MGIVWTLRARGLAPSLGAGGSLVVAVLCCLIFATAVLTFRDWPGSGDAAPGGTITLPAPPAKAAGRSASGPSAPAASAAAAAPARRRSTASRPARRSAPRRAGRAPAPASPTTPAAPAPAPVAAAPVASQPAASAPQGASPSSPGPQRPSPGPAETIVGTVRGQAEPLLPPVVAEPVQPVLDTVQQVGRTVDDVAGPLLPTLP